MDMVSFETKAEQDFIYNLMKSSGIKDVHTAGRLCDGCYYWTVYFVCCYGCYFDVLQVVEEVVQTDLPFG